MENRPSSEEYFERTVEQTVVSAVLRAAGPTRRQLLVGLGASALTGLIAELFPLGRLTAFAADPVGKPEKKDVSIGFIPITCGTPIIMAEPLGFYKKHGLNASVKRAAGWAMIRDWAVNKEVDASHFLSPMPLAFTLGAGSLPTPFYMPAVENINGQAITLHIKHKGVKTAADMKGFRFCVPFDFSMHNYLLRYFLAEKPSNPPFPDGEYVPFSHDPAQWAYHLILPWFCLSVLFIGFYGRVLRSNMLDTMSEDYVRTARAKGLPPRQILGRHVLRNSLIPIVTLFGLDFAAVLGGGAILTETVFDLKGVGWYAAQSVGSLDLPPIMGVTLYGAFFIVVFSALVDFVYAFLDPRIRPT